jgi:hypothetical protein
MSYRLGAYECPRCGNSEAVLRAAQGAPGGPPQNERVTWHIDPQGAPPAAAPRRIRASETPVYGASAGLEGEKKLYFTIQAVTWGVLLLGFLGIGGLAGASVPDAGAILAVAGALVFFAAIINLGLAYFVLFSELAWAKWCCGLITLIGLISSIGSFLRHLGDMPGAELGSPLLAMVIRIVYFLISALPLAFNLWLLSILYRDIGSSRIDY